MTVDPKALEAAKSAYTRTSSYPIVPGNHDAALSAAIEAALEALPPIVGAEPVVAGEIPDLLDRYWELAYAEGTEGRDHDTINGEAQEVRAKLGLAFLATPSTPVATNMPMGDKTRKQFPVLDSGGNKVDWQLVADHERQAQTNHHQSVQDLASRGGLAWVELHAVLNDRRYEDMDDFEAMVGCRRIEAAYLSTPCASPSDVTQMLREIVNQCNASGVTQIPAGSTRPDLEVLRRLLDNAVRALTLPQPSPVGRNAVEGEAPDLAKTFANWRAHYSAASEERRLFDQIAAALATPLQSSRDEMVEAREVGWVIETASGTYWTGRSPTDFNSDHGEACRFARLQDAERVRCWLIERRNHDLAMACRSSEHVWLAAIRSIKEGEAK